MGGEPRKHKPCTRVVNGAVARSRECDGRQPAGYCCKLGPATCIVKNAGAPGGIDGGTQRVQAHEERHVAGTGENQ